MGRHAMEGNEMVWNETEMKMEMKMEMEMEWNEMEWIGIEWNGAEWYAWNGTKTRAQTS